MGFAFALPILQKDTPSHSRDAKRPECARHRSGCPTTGIEGGIRSSRAVSGMTKFVISPPIFGDFDSASSDAERALIGEKRRRASCVQEDDVLVFAPASLADQGDKAREPLA